MIGKVGARWFAAIALAVLIGWLAMRITTAQAWSEREAWSDGMSELRQVFAQFDRAVRYPITIDLRFQ